MGDLSEDASDDVEGLDASAAHVANLLSTEPPDSRFLLQHYKIHTVSFVRCFYSFRHFICH